MWGVRGRALSDFRPPVLWGVQPVPTTHWLRVRGLWAWGPVTNPQRALLRAGFARCGGGTWAPGGGVSCLCVGRPGSGAVPPPTACPLGRAAGARYPLAVDAGGAGVGTRHQPHSARSCELALRTVGAAGEGPRGAPFAWTWGVRGRALPRPGLLVLWAVRPAPTTYWLWVRGCGRWDPSPTPQRPLLRAGFAFCEGGTRAPGGGASCLGVGRPGLGALPPPTALPLGRAAGAHYQLAVAAGGAGVETPHQPDRTRSCELALRTVGAARGRPGGAPFAWTSGYRGWALSHPRPLFLWGVLPKPITSLLWVRGLRAWGPLTNPTARALASWPCALSGRHEGTRGGHLLPGAGASRVGRSPGPDRSSVEACGRGPLPTGCGRGGCGCGDPSPTPQRALLRAGFARRGGGTRAPGGDAPCRGVGRPGSGALPAPTARPLGRAAGARYPVAVGAGGAGVRTRHQPHSARSCELALRAVGAARRAPGGDASCLCVGRSGSGAL